MFRERLTSRKWREKKHIKKSCYPYTHTLCSSSTDFIDDTFSFVNYSKLIKNASWNVFYRCYTFDSLKTVVFVLDAVASDHPDQKCLVLLSYSCLYIIRYNRYLKVASSSSAARDLSTKMVLTPRWPVFAVANLPFVWRKRDVIKLIIQNVVLAHR